MSSFLLLSDGVSGKCPAYAASMVNVRVRATATRWESDDQPGWVEASVLDARRKEHRIVEKEPVLFSPPEQATADSPFPFEFYAADVISL